ncbi:MAG: radical SAM protein [Deltaproteobacteria bacterium]|nr:radical SAM protein [Deltaproteobacteria bacterium]MBW2361353.1 radical SAM protein [Deltaproteobacteria bacterium]
MRILFLSTNRFRIEVVQPMPIGLACVIAGIDENAHAIEVVDLMFSEDPAAELTAALERFRPELVAVSIRNTDNLSHLAPQYFLPEAKQMLDICREVSGAKIVVGGAAFTTVPEALFEYLEPDFGIAGDGEIAFPQLVECIENDTDWSEVPGLVWRANGRVRTNAPAFIEDWNGLRLPRRDLFDLRKYAEVGGASNIVISQGCPMRCHYCDDPHRLGRKQRRKAVEQVIDELEAMSAEASDMPIFFTAPIFNSPASNAKKVCRGIIERGLEIRWTGLIHPAFLDDELAELMQRSGCMAVSLSCDSCSERMLETLRKDITKQQLESAIALLEKHGILYMLTILFGGPGEDRESIDETLDFLRSKKPLMVAFALGIRILPNTALAEMAVEQRLIAADDPLMEPKYYLSPGVEGWARGYLEEVCAERDDWSFSVLEESSDVISEALPPH